MEFQDPLFLYVIIILSSIVHEYSHGAVAYALGDPTAKNAGRLTLNPFAHMDLWGTVLLPWILMILTSFRVFFGYAKPVPFNPYNLKNYKLGLFLIGLAGPLSNLVLAVILGLMARFSVFSALDNSLTYIVYINIWLALFNLLPFAPADGSKILAGILPYPLDKNIESLNPAVGIILSLVAAYFILPIIAPIVAGLIIGRI